MSEGGTAAAGSGGRRRSRSKSRGWEYQKARQEFLRRLADDPNQPKEVRDFARRQNEAVEQGRRRRRKVHPNYDTGHRVPRIAGEPERPENFQLEHSSDNRAKGPRERVFWRKKWLARLIRALKRRGG